jgi:hypothetical protein
MSRHNPVSPFEGLKEGFRVKNKGENLYKMPVAVHYHVALNTA